MVWDRINTWQLIPRQLTEKLLSDKYKRQDMWIFKSQEKKAPMYNASVTMKILNNPWEEVPKDGRPLCTQ